MRLPLIEHHDGDYWRDRAAEAHAKADQMRTPEARRSLLFVAESYHNMAEREDQRRTQEAANSARLGRHHARFGR